MSVFHWFRAQKRTGDVDYFYNTALNAESWVSVFGLGSKFIAFLIYPLVKGGVSYFSLFLLFSLISLVPYIYLFKQFIEIAKKKSSKIILFSFLFFPSIHFWTVFFGKEAILMPLMFYLLVKIKHNDYKNPTLYCGLFLTLLIRPYLCFILIFSFVLSILLDKSKTRVFKKKMFLFCFSMLVIVTPFLLIFLKIKSWDNIVNRYRLVANYANTNGNTSINLLESNYFERLFLTLFRPFFYEGVNIFHFFVSIENLLFLLFLIFLALKIKKNEFLSQPINVKFAFFTATFLILFYSIYMYNLGLANRMKVMFVPYLVYVYFSLNETKPKLLA